ncbi:hypothetical protein I6B53_02280 [Schaalia sp. 19OD2882]|uniref:DUF6112 family protein n=1 Tax=Schaalia sp. 19OD2882 TaxID=2794089 RepID=UPI001C1EE4E2|nr:DUF6112 family protein [Schaalia sp. 19OD2882]QWW19961.1 hypothetical protein I6B53_02280 [Schaalia sp. 19OD2882]
MFDLVICVLTTLPLLRHWMCTSKDDSLPGIMQWHTIVGTVMTIVLIVSVPASLVPVVVWGLGTNSHNPNRNHRRQQGFEP